MASFVSLRCPSCVRNLVPTYLCGMLYETDTRGRWRCPRCGEIFLLVGDGGGHMAGLGSSDGCGLNAREVLRKMVQEEDDAGTKEGGE